MVNIKKKIIVLLSLVAVIGFILYPTKQDSVSAVLPKGYEEVSRMKIDIDGKSIHVIQLKNRKNGCIKTLSVSEKRGYTGLSVALETEWTIEKYNAGVPVAVPYCEKKGKK